MANRRDAILRGASRAAELHSELGIRTALATGDRPVDVLQVMRDIGMALLFRPLNSLLGAYLPNGGNPGILITTQRDLHIQRFTAAHELGHHLLGHHASLDADVGFVARGERDFHDEQELEADSFAAEFLLPKWLLVAHARRHQWGKADLRESDAVYQLSLRLGVSYAATCWSLLTNGLIDQKTAQSLLATQPKACKQRALPDVPVESWRRDVWLLSERDRGIQVMGGPDDYLIFSLEEAASSGYVWDFDPIISAGLEISKDETKELGNGIGAHVVRRVVAHGPAQSHIRIEERRPWTSDENDNKAFEIDATLVGNQPEGLPSWERLAA